MRKIISMILAMAMIITTFGAMTAFAKVADTTVGDFHYSVYELYNEDFNGYEVDGETYDGASENRSFQGLDNDIYLETNGVDGKQQKKSDLPEGVTDLDTYVNPTRFQYIPRGTGDTAVKFTYDPSVTYTYGPPYVSVYNVPKNAADYPDAKALIAEYEIMFPEEITESSKRMYHWTKLIFYKADGKTANHFETLNFSTGVISESDPSTKFSIRSGSKYKNIEAGKYYKITQVLDFDEKLISYYIDDEHFADSNVNMYDSFKSMDYIRFVGTDYDESGFVIDNYHYYYATDRAPVVEEETRIYQRARIYNDVIDFEPVGGNSYTISGGYLNKPDRNILYNVQNQSFGAKETVATYLADKTTASGSNRTTTIAAIPSGYVNSNGKGTAAMKITGDGYMNQSAIHQLNISLAGGGDRYPGGANMKEIACEGDIYVSQFDLAFHELPNDRIILFEHRNDADWGRYSTLYMQSTGQLTFHNINTTKSLSPKTWYNIKFVGYSSTGNLELYVDDVLITTLKSPTKKLGYWDSVRLYGGQGNRATSEEVYYDNMNFYIGTYDPGTFTATGYEAGVTEDGADVTLTATTNESGQTAAIQRSDDGSNWTTIGTGTVNVKTTKDSVYYRAMYGVNYSDTIVVYGVEKVAGNPYTQITSSNGAIDFEGAVTHATAEGGSLRVSGVDVKTLHNGGVVTYGNTKSITSIAKDPHTAGTHGDVLKIINSSAYGERQLQVSPGVGENFLKDSNNYRHVLEFDYYIDTTNATNTASTSTNIINSMVYRVGGTHLHASDSNLDRDNWVIATAVTDANKNTVIKSNNGVTVGIANKEWVHILASWDVYGNTSIYVDGKELVKDVKMSKGTNPMTRYNYIRSQSGKDNGIVHYYDNWHLYEARIPELPTTPYIKLSKIVYDNDGVAINKMEACSALNATATVKNNGVAANAVVIFARYTNGGKKLAAISIKPITMATGQTAITVKGELGKSSATDKVKVFIWDGLGTLVPQGVEDDVKTEL